jgi:hypothetical protein
MAHPLVNSDHQADSPTGIAVLTCAVLETEIEHFASDASHIVRIEKLEQGLHNDPDQLRIELQAVVDRVEADNRVDAIVLGYGLCSRGIEGVFTRRCRMIVVRAHDCITLLLGSKERYADYVAKHPGTYWYSPGWNRHHIPPGPERYQKYYDQYREQYGEDNAAFLMETEQQWFTTYNRATYVDLTIGATDEDIDYTRECADWLEWDFDRVSGDPGLMQALLGGEWDTERFCVLQPRQTIRMTADERVIEAVDVNNDSA